MHCTMSGGLVAHIPTTRNYYMHYIKCVYVSFIYAERKQWTGDFMYNRKMN